MLSDAIAVAAMLFMRRRPSVMRLAEVTNETGWQRRLFATRSWQRWLYLPAQFKRFDIRLVDQVAGASPAATA